MIATSSPPPAKDGGLVSADLGTDLLGEKHSNVKRRLPEAGQGWPTPGAGIHKMHLISSSEAHRVCLSAVFRSRRSKNKTRTRDLSPPAFVHLQANLLVFYFNGYLDTDPRLKLDSTVFNLFIITPSSLATSMSRKSHKGKCKASNHMRRRTF